MHPRDVSPSTGSRVQIKCFTGLTTKNQGAARTNGMLVFTFIILILKLINPAAMRPSTLKLQHLQNHDVPKSILREAYAAWNDRSDNCIVPEPNIQPLFRDFKLFPTTGQVHDMLQTAKQIVRGFSNGSKLSKHKNGLTFGEFSVLLSDIRKLRHTTILNSNDTSQSGYCQTDSSSSGKKTNARHDEPSVPSNETMVGPEVFLGGSCNPTTWRADVAIPKLNELGITFYNPQVSEWTPDLLELEHRAKEKAKVLFFVMDSQTRSAAGAIEVAHIAGRNSKHLVLVLLPYKQQQKILNETLTLDEYMDLSRNQQLLKHLVHRRGLPVLDKISLALEHIKIILSGGPCRKHPHNIATRLISVRRTFDRVSNNSSDVINLTQCQTALVALGYTSGIVSISVIKQVLAYFDAVCQMYDGKAKSNRSPSAIYKISNGYDDDNITITFDGFCILESYLSVLQQEIQETSCVSPIKGTNLQQPPIYLTDVQGWNHRVPPSPISTGKNCTLDAAINTKNKSIHSSITKVFNNTLNASGGDNTYYNDAFNASSSTSFENSFQNTLISNNKSVNEDHTNTNRCVQLQQRNDVASAQVTERSNSNDSSDHSELNGLKPRDLYLGGSCWMLTNWRQKYAVPYLKSKNITFYTSNLHESPEGSLNFSETGEISMTNNDELIFNPAILDASRILLFVITNQTRSLGAMTMAAHYMGMGYNVVLCVQMLHNECIINGLQLTNSAIKDYNRGRVYLSDLAKRQGIPVFNDIEEALKSAVDKLRSH
ncbi:uncharacterized protein raw [Ochlerotatus camptorhynchus]|uniref:uncharacterized protein raw n=1 Tax=Ochlerotatus camptorhynchus TaxID=644619 RepID=UPI0031D99353